MLKFYKSRKGSQNILYEEKPELENVELTAQNIKNHIGDSSDIVIRELFINGNKKLSTTLFFVDGLVDSGSINDYILKPLLQEEILEKAINEKDIIHLINHGVLYYNSIQVIDKIDEAIEDILNGFAALVFDKEQKAVVFDVRGFEIRSITEPTGENVIKGSKDAFIEVLRVNTSLVRRKIKTQNLRIKETKVGIQTLTGVAVVYVEGLANENIVNEVFKRLDSINTEGALVAGAIEEYIIDNKWTAFPQVIYTERPDKFCDNLLDGRVGIIIDGLPVTYIVPATFSIFFQAPEDYANNYFVASLTRLIRYSAYVATLLIPGFYISVTTFHQEMIPTDLALSIIKSKEGVPFPTFIEVFGMLIAFELLIEAGIRLPKTIGQAVSIVGAVVVGQAAVSARLVSPAVVVIVALTGIAGFVMPNQDFSSAIRFWRLFLVICSSIAGLFGLTNALLVMGYQLIKMETFGVPYFSPFVANEGKDIMQDTILRMPLFTIKKRPTILKTTNKQRHK